MREIRRRSTWILLVAGCLSGCTSERASPEPVASQDETVPTCNTLKSYLESFGFSATLTSSGDPCTVEASEALADIRFEIDPFESLRDSLVDAGWTELIEFSADGAGTGSFRVVRDELYCQVSGGAPAWVDDDNEIRQVDVYSFDVSCGHLP